MSLKTTRLSLLLSFTPFLLMPVLFIFLKIFQSSTLIVHAPLSFCVLNTVVLFLIACAVSFVAARGYHVNGSPVLLLLGGGVFAFGAGSLSSMIKFMPGWANVTATTNDVASLLASGLHFAAVLACYMGWKDDNGPAVRRRKLLLTFGGTTVFLSLAFILSAYGFMPVFFDESGPTLLRQVLLSTAIVLLSFSSLAIMNSYFENKSTFLYWYSLALLLRVVAQAAFFVQPAVGSPIGWLGVLSKHLASIYFLISVRSAFLESREKGLSFKEAVSEIIRAPGLYWQDIMDNIGDAVISVNSRGKILVWNKAAERIFGYSSAEANGRPFTLIIPEARSVELERLLGRGHGTLETELKRKDGSIVSLEISASKNNLSMGDVTTLVIRDVTERKRAERRLWQSQEQYKNVVMDQTELICRFIPNGILKFVNPALCQMAEMDESELIGHSFFMFLSDEDIYRVIDLMNEVTPEDPIRSISLDVHVKDKVYFMNWNGRALFDSNGDLVEYQAVGRDKTEQKRAEDALLEREAKLQSIFNSSPVGIGIVVDRVFAEVNSTFCYMVGYSAEELLGRSARMIYPSDHVYEYVGRVKYEMMDKKGVGMVEAQVQHKKGNIIDIMLSSTPIDPGRPEKGVTFSALDITNRKQAEEALKRANAELESKVRDRTAQLSRSNNSLLTEIEEHKRSEKSLRLAQKNLRAMASELVFAEERSRQHFATDLHDTVVQTLGAAKLRGQLIQEQIPADAKPVFTEMQDMVSESITQARQIMSEMSPPVLYELGFIPALEWLAEQIGSQHGIAVTLEKQGGADSLAHEVQVLMFQAVRELLMNVVKHAGATEALIKTSRDHNAIRISVRDNGRGFSGKVSFRPDRNGGFGLFSIRERLKYLGGQLTIHSIPGQGTRVMMTAPGIPENPFI